MFADILKAPAVQAIARRVEAGGAQTFGGVAPGAQPFFAALLQTLFPDRTIVVVAENLKTQESFLQDLETWLPAAGPAPTAARPLLFYPAWEILPGDGKLPHADVISDRLQTLVALSPGSAAPAPALIVTSVVALLQKTFAPADLAGRARQLQRGDSIAPLDLIEFLEAQGYEPEAQVSQKGELSLRGGIVDIFPPTSPWPVRLEFFGDELESLRYFDPLTQISREEISRIVIPPAGEIGLLRNAGDQAEAATPPPALATLLDHLPRKSLFVLCEPEALAAHADDYAQQIAPDGSLLYRLAGFPGRVNRRGLVALELWRSDVLAEVPPAAGDGLSAPPLFGSLDVFRPLAERAPEPQIAEIQRREFFLQLHRWLRQDLCRACILQQ